MGTSVVILVTTVILVSLCQNTVNSVPSDCVYGEIDVAAQINQIKTWMDRELPNGRRDDWWLSVYLQTSSFNVQQTEAHLQQYYEFKKGTRSVSNQRKWFIKFLEGDTEGLSDEANESNREISRLLDNGVLIPLLSTSPLTGAVLFIRLGAIGEDTPYSALVTILSMFWDWGLYIASSHFVEDVQAVTQSVCQGRTLPISTTTNGCNHLQSNRITKPNPNHVPSLLAKYFASVGTPEFSQFFATAILSGAVAVVDLAGVPLSRIPELLPLVPTLEKCLSIYPSFSLGIHVFTGEGQEGVVQEFGNAIQDAVDAYSDSTTSQLIELSIHGGDYSVLYQCGIPQSVLPKEYGGSAGTVSDLQVFWKTVLLGGAEIYKHEDTFT